MSKTPTHSFRLSRPKSSTTAFGMCAMMPLLALGYSAIFEPLMLFSFPPDHGLEGMLESRIEDRIFWPLLAAISLVLAARHWSRIPRPLAPNIISLLAYLAFAGTSVLWAFKPELSFIRFVKEIMVLATIVLPALLAARTADIVRGMFLCFALGSVVNVLLIPGGYATLAQYGSTMVDIGYQGYFSGKNFLGEFAALALLLSIHELLNRGHRRVLGIIGAAMAAVLLYYSNSKTALGVAFLAPALAAVALLISRAYRVSPAIILVLFLFGCVVFSMLTGFGTERIAYMLTGDSSFTGRTIIWDFAEAEIARSPLVGWGYQSFWLVGPDAPSILDAPGWVKLMPNAHNGYYDAMLELGYVGLALLVTFLVTTVHVIGRMAEHDSKRAWLLLSVSLYIITHDFLETTWMRSFEMLWVVFVIVAVEAARYWRSSPLIGTASASGPAGSVSPGRFRGGWRVPAGSRAPTNLGKAAQRHGL
jgi:exopolysaccharide production protein ExoQ